MDEKKGFSELDCEVRDIKDILMPEILSNIFEGVNQVKIGLRNIEFWANIIARQHEELDNTDKELAMDNIGEINQSAINADKAFEDAINSGSVTISNVGAFTLRCEKCGTDLYKTDTEDKVNTDKE